MVQNSEEFKKETTKISIFSHVEDNVPKELTLGQWLYNTINPTEKFKKIILEYRDSFDVSLKKSLPCCTISAEFEERRSLNNIVQKNKLICIDIDRYSKSKKRKCNICVDMLLVKEMFMEHPCTLYVGKSVSGDGIYAILRIHDEDRLEDYFEYFKKSFARIGVNIDESCKDYTRLRFLSYDPDAYYNPDALYYRLAKKQHRERPTANPNVSLNDIEKVERIIKFIEQTAMDITQSYENWVKIGAALYAGFGDSGRDYFHKISSYYHDYSSEITEKKWNQCRKMTKINLSSLFYVASSYGVRY